MDDQFLEGILIFMILLHMLIQIIQKLKLWMIIESSFRIEMLVLLLAENRSWRTTKGHKEKKELSKHGA